MSNNNNGNGGATRGRDPDSEKFKDMMERLGPTLAKTSAGLIDPARLAQVALNATIKLPKLLLCTQRSVASALITAATLGLEPNSPAQHCFILPYKNNKKGAIASKKAGKSVTIYEAQFVMGAAGLIYLACHKGKVCTSVSAREIYKGEEYKFEGGTPHDTIYHPIAADIERDDRKYGELIVAAYCVLHMPAGPPVVQWMFREEIERIRNRDYTRDTGPWATDYAMMSRKTVLKRGFKYVPMGSDLALAIEIDGRAAVGKDLGDLIMLPPGLDIESDESAGVEDAGPSQADRVKDGIKNARKKDTEAADQKDDKPATKKSDKPKTAKPKSARKKTTKSDESETPAEPKPKPGIDEALAANGKPAQNGLDLGGDNE